jgi:probable HAF family extracellular repeat protein
MPNRNEKRRNNISKGDDMKTKLRLSLSVIVFAFLLAPGVLAAQTGQHPARYAVTDLGTLGGGYSFSYGLNNAGVVSGGAATATQTDFFSQTGFLWHRGQIINVGTLGGAACPDCNSEAGGPNAAGLSPVISETAVVDPNGEDFCGFGTFRQCLGAIYNNGSLNPLAPLGGGNNTQAYWTNKAGETVGFSETGTYDGNCIMPSQFYRFSAVKWSAGGTPHPLNPLAGDTVSFGLGINDLGQAVGVSGLCSDTTFPPNNTPGGTHAVLWNSNGTPVLIPDLPNAVGNNVAGSINNRGDVVGTQVTSDGIVHAYLWSKNGGIRDIMFPNAFVTVTPCCHSINDSGEATGFAFDENGPETFVWKDGNFTDLNSVLPAGNPWYIFNTASINEAGQIAASGFNINTGEMHAVLLTPISPVGAPVARGRVKSPALPDTVLRKFQPKRSLQ